MRVLIAHCGTVIWKRSVTHTSSETPKQGLQWRDLLEEIIPLKQWQLCKGCGRVLLDHTTTSQESPILV